jgi:glycosyltransferase involved in cell wall biosynthesis
MLGNNNNNENSVSIALAVYNGEKFLPSLLSSLQSQTLQPVELVVVDDYSTDDSINIINKFSLPFEKKVFLNERNMGPIYTFKRLTGLCKGNFISFCDQDDIWLPEKLALTIAVIKKIEGHTAGLAFTDLSVIDEEGSLIHESYWKVRSVMPEKFSFSDMLFGNIITGCTAMINRKMADEIVKKMPLNVMMHDHWIALIAYSFGKYSFIDKPTVLFRSHQNSVTNKEKTTSLAVLINDFKKGNNYLQENIEQAIEFKNRYYNYLSKQDANKLDDFIDLQKRPFFYKRFMRDKRSLLRRLK